MGEAIIQTDTEWDAPRQSGSSALPSPSPPTFNHTHANSRFLSGIKSIGMEDKSNAINALFPGPEMFGAILPYGIMIQSFADKDTEQLFN